MKRISRVLALCLSAPLLLGGCSQGPEGASPRPAPVGMDKAQTRLSQLFGVSSGSIGRDIFNEQETRSTATPPSAETAGLPLLAGIVMQGGIPAAFFVSAGVSETVREGERVAGRYQVVRIDAASVVLKDVSTGKSYQLLLSGT